MTGSGGHAGNTGSDLRPAAVCTKGPARPLQFGRDLHRQHPTKCRASWTPSSPAAEQVPFRATEVEGLRGKNCTFTRAELGDGGGHSPPSSPGPQPSRGLWEVVWSRQLLRQVCREDAVCNPPRSQRDTAGLFWGRTVRV